MLFTLKKNLTCEHITLHFENLEPPLVSIIYKEPGRYIGKEAGGRRKPQKIPITKSLARAQRAQAQEARETQEPECPEKVHRAIKKPAQHRKKGETEHVIEARPPRKLSVCRLDLEPTPDRSTAPSLGSHLRERLFKTSDEAQEVHLSSIQHLRNHVSCMVGTRYF